MLKRQFHRYTQPMIKKNQLVGFRYNSLKKTKNNIHNTASFTANRFLPFKLVSYENQIRNSVVTVFNFAEYITGKTYFVGLSSDCKCFKQDYNLTSYCTVYIPC